MALIGYVKFPYTLDDAVGIASISCSTAPAPKVKYAELRGRLGYHAIDERLLEDADSAMATTKALSASPHNELFVTITDVDAEFAVGGASLGLATALSVGGVISYSFAATGACQYNSYDTCPSISGVDSTDKKALGIRQKGLGFIFPAANIEEVVSARVGPVGTWNGLAQTSFADPNFTQFAVSTLPEVLAAFRAWGVDPGDLIPCYSSLRHSALTVLSRL